jgi:hypothetical protein
MSTKTPECWASDPQTKGLRIEVSPGRSLLLPHDQFIFAELTSGGDEQHLKLVFATHEVSVHGHRRQSQSPVRQIELSELREALSAAIGKLPPRLAQVFQLYEVEEKPNRELCMPSNKLTDDKIDGNSIANSEERVFGIGPGLSYNQDNSQDKLWITLNGYFETGAENRAEGIEVVLRISLAF